MINKAIASVLPLFPKKIIWLFSKRYIAGEHLNDALKISAKYNKDGIFTTLDVLGEFVTKAEKIEYYKTQYIITIEESVKAGINTTFSLKPTMFGLLIDEKMCFNHIRDIVSIASQYNRMIRIDMEDSTCTSREIDIFLKLYSEFPANVGLVLQAYLRRTLDDLEHIGKFNQKQFPVNIRLCKGIYVEPEEIAFKKRSEINNNYNESLEFLFNNGFYPAIATHDKELINHSYTLIEKHKATKDKYEFQMLYGVTPDLCRSIVHKGHHMRIYVPFGKEWLNYSLRRLKENPKMVQHIIKAMIIRN